jgi:hypothetical protein
MGYHGGREQRYCDQCGGQLPAGARICDRCGAEQPPPDHPSAGQRRGERTRDQQSGREQRQPRRQGRRDSKAESGSNRRRQGRRDRRQGGGRGTQDSGTSIVVILIVAIAGLGFLLLIAAPILGAFVLGLGDSVEATDERPPEETAELFLEAYVAGDEEELRRLAHSEGPAAGRLDGDLSLGLTGSEFAEVDPVTVEESDDRRVVSVRIEYQNTDRTTADLRIVLRRENGAWRIWKFPAR